MTPFHRVLIFAANVAVVLSIAFVAFTAKWAGWEFCLGAIVGGAFIAVAVRMKLGYWP